MLSPYGLNNNLKGDTVMAKTVNKDPLEELVPFYAFKDNDKYKDDIFVSVNGETCQIQRGKQVMIKRKFYNVLMRSQEQDARAADLMTEQNRNYIKAAHAL